MKRIMRFFAVTILAFLLTGCGGTASSSSSSVDNRVEITGVTLSNSTITYDGNPHSILIEGTLPSGVTVAYTNNAKTDVGVYEVTATLTGAGYFTKSLQATLTIQNRTITGVTFSNASVVYDGALHKIEVSGTLPQGVSVSYASDVTGITNEASEVGTYHMVATLSGTAYTTLTLTATLTILPYGETTFAGITFTNQTYVYDGTEHVITISGTLPAGALVVYSSTTQGVTNAATAVGVYNVTAVISKTGYQTLTLQAVLTISQAQTQQFTGVSFSSQTIEYDSFEHEIVVEGVLPEGTTVEYDSDVDGIANRASETGDYHLTATISKLGYETLELEATLTIKASDKERFIIAQDGNIYFNNALDQENLYAIDQDGIRRVNRDEARYFIEHNGMLYYVSKGLVTQSIRSFNGTATQTVYGANAEYLLSDGTALYYAVNSLVGESGIYCLDIDAEEPTVTKIFTGKAKQLTLVGDLLYFTNGTDGYKLYSISKTAIDGTPTLVLDEKIKEMTYYNGSFYVTINHLLGDYLARYILASDTLVKLTSDNAKYLTIAGGYVYYSNIDLLNSNLFGKGLYRVGLNALVSSSLPGEKIYDTEYNVSSLYAQDASTVLFYRLSDKHLLSIDTGTKVVTDLLEDFVPPVHEGPQALSKFESFVWGNRVYFINNYVEGALFYYNTLTGSTVRVTASGVKSFSIIGDYLFFNQISWLVNNDIYMINLREGGLPERISTNDGRDMVVYGNSLYYVKENEVGVGTTITRLTLDETLNEVDVYDYNVHNLTIQDGKLYFIKGTGVDEIWRADILPSGDLANFIRLGTEKTDWFILVGNSMYYRAVGTFVKTLSKMDLDGTNKEVVISGYDPISFIAKDGYLYFTNDTLTSPTDGIYRAHIDGTNIQLLHANASGDGFGAEMHIAGNYLYYYSRSDVNGDFKFHRLNLITLVSEEIV